MSEEILTQTFTRLRKRFLQQARRMLPSLEDAEDALQDVFVPKMGDTRNLTFRLTFRHENRTLRDAEVDKERDKIAAGLVKALGVKI